MYRKVTDLRLFDRVNTRGDVWGTVTGLAVDRWGKIQITSLGWRAPGLAFTDVSTLAHDDFVDYMPADFIPTLVDLAGHLIEDTAAA